MRKKPFKRRNLKPKTPDAAVVSLIKKIRHHHSTPYPIRFFFYFSSKKNATEAATELRRRGFEDDIFPPSGSSTWLCLATKQMMAETADLVALTGEFTAFARTFHGTYDGWEAEL